MGGESIKPIRKRIHVYFLMTAYTNLCTFKSGPIDADRAFLYLNSMNGST